MLSVNQMEQLASDGVLETHETKLNTVLYECGLKQVQVIPNQFNNILTWPSPILSKFGRDVVLTVSCSYTKFGFIPCAASHLGSKLHSLVFTLVGVYLNVTLLFFCHTKNQKHQIKAVIMGFDLIPYICIVFGILSEVPPIKIKLRFSEKNATLILLKLSWYIRWTLS